MINKDCEQAATLLFLIFRLLFMRKVNIQPKYINRFLLLALFASLTGFWAKADVVYAIPLKGVEHQMGNLLEWSTALEKNTHTFIIEKSTNGIDYLNAGTIRAAGSSIESKKYRFLDLGVNEKLLHYRLKQIDSDGTSSFSEPILVEKELSNQFMVVAMGNPEVDESFDISIDVLNNVALEYTLKNKQGEIISNNQQELYTGLNDIQINLENETEGVYFVSLRVDKEEEILVINKVADPKKKSNLVSKPLKKGG